MDQQNALREQHKQRVHETKVTAREKLWLNYQQSIPGKVAVHTMTTKGTAPAFGMQAFLDRVEEINWLAKTQTEELESCSQELARSGISSFSLSSSKPDADDDDMLMEISDEEIERNACRYGTAYTAMDRAPIMRRIEWEQYATKCGTTQKIWLAAKPDGSGFTVETDSVKVTKETLIDCAKRLKAALDDRTPEDLANDRDRVRFYGGYGSKLYGVTKGDHPGIEQSMDELGQEDLMTNESNGGPQELGLHNLLGGVVQYEPTEYEFWPDEDMPLWMQDILDGLNTDPKPEWLPDYEGMGSNAFESELFGSYNSINS